MYNLLINKDGNSNVLSTLHIFQSPHVVFPVCMQQVSLFFCIQISPSSKKISKIELGTPLQGPHFNLISYLKAASIQSHFKVLGVLRASTSELWADTIQHTKGKE